MLQHIDTLLAFAVVMLLLSLVVTTMVQFVVAGLNLRGHNLLWGVSALLQRHEGVSKEVATELGKAVLNHEAVARGGRKIWKYAKVIGSKELVTVLEDLSKSPGNLSEAARTSLASLMGPAADQEVLRAAKDGADQLAAKFAEFHPDAAEKVEAVRASLALESRKVAKAVDRWFDTIMTRTTDRFIAHTRVASIACAAILAVGFQIDSVDLFRQVSTDAELRSALVAMADQTLERADVALSREPIARETLSQVLPAGTEVPAEIVGRARGAAWLTEHFEGHDSLATWRTRYEVVFDSLAPLRLEALGDQLGALRSDLEASRLDLLSRDRRAEKATIPGLLLTIILLSLGAPFWFNALRSLAALRPMLAGRADPDKKSG